MAGRVLTDVDLNLLNGGGGQLKTYGNSACSRAPPERANCPPAAEHRAEPAAAHSLTSAARASSVSGAVRPRAFAVLRLITSSYFVGACTGRSAGFSPLRMRST